MAARKKSRVKRKVKRRTMVQQASGDFSNLMSGPKRLFQMAFGQTSVRASRRDAIVENARASGLSATDALQKLKLQRQRERRLSRDVQRIKTRNERKRSRRNRFHPGQPVASHRG